MHKASHLVLPCTLVLFGLAEFGEACGLVRGYRCLTSSCVRGVLNLEQPRMLLRVVLAAELL